MVWVWFSASWLFGPWLLFVLNSLIKWICEAYNGMPNYFLGDMEDALEEIDVLEVFMETL